MNVSSSQVLHGIAACHRHGCGHFLNVNVIDSLDCDTVPKHQSIRIKDRLLSFLEFLLACQ